MKILGVGPLEFIFVLIIIFLVLGPEDMVSTGKRLGRFVGQMRRSNLWNGINKMTREIRDLPTSLMQEADLDELSKELKQDAEKLKNISKRFEDDPLKEIKEETQAGMDFEDIANSVSLGKEMIDA